MSASSGRTIAVTHRLLVALQIFVIAASLVAPAAVLASDPSADPSGDPTPTTEPTPTAEPTPEPTATPTEAPSPTVEPTDEPSADPTPASTETPAPPEPTADPTTAPAPAPTIESDQADYAPGALVTLTGTGWQPGESVYLFVNDHAGSTWNRSVTVSADENGDIVDRFNLPDWFVAEYSVTATGSESGVAQTTFTDARVVTTATLNGATSVTVAASASITAVVNVTTDGSGANARWRSTAWRIATTPPGTITCVDHADHDGAGTYAETFSIAAPSTTGTFNAYFRASADDTCGGAGGGASAVFTLTDGVVVNRPTTTIVTSNNDPSTFGQSVTFTATVTATGGNPSGVGTVSFTDDGNALCTTVPLVTNQATCTTSALGAKATPHDIVATYSGTTSGSPQFGSSTSAAFKQDVNKASSTTMVDCPVSVVYTGSALTPCTVSVTGAGGLNLTPTPTYTDNTDVGTATASYTYPGDANHTGSAGSDTFAITKAGSTTVVTCPASVVYTGSLLTPCTVSVTGAGGLDLSPTPTYTSNLVVGTASASYTYGGDANHDPSGGSDTFEITPASSTTLVDCPADATYTGSPLTPCTVSVTGAGGLDLGPAPTYTDNTNVGTATASYTYTGDSNHTGSSGSDTFEIEQAPSVTTVTCPVSVVYDGTAQEPCTANVTGAGGLDVDLSVDYSDNIDAGTATASAAFTGDANHEPSGDSVTFEIEQAPSTTSITCPISVVYDGSAQEPCTAEVTGAGGLQEPVAVTYADNTNAGTATASAAYAGDANHTGSGDSTTFEIEQAPSVTVVTCPLSVVYSGSTQEPCTANVTGAGGLDEAVAVTYADNTNAGTATASAAYAGDANHTGSGDSTTFEIEKAPSTTTVTCPTSVVYDGSAQEPCTATVTGAGGLDLDLTVSYADNTNAGTATASAAFDGDLNHEPSDDTTTFEIEKAPSTTTVTCPASVVYDGAAQAPCTANVTGIGGLDETVAVTYLSNTTAGTATASAAFDGDLNDEPSDDSTTFEIEKAASVTVVTCPASVVYDGTAHEPCTANVTGAGGLDEPVAVSYTDNTDAGAASASAAFAGDANHEPSGDTSSFDIDPAPSTTVVTCPVSVVFTGSPITPCTAEVTGVGGLDLDLTVTYADNTNAGTANASAAYAGDANHDPSADSTAFEIDKASSTTTVDCPASVTYTGSPLTPCTVSVTGAGGLSLTPDPTYSDNTNVGTATASYTYAGDANHTGSSGSDTFAITKASSTTVVTCPASVVYTGSPLTPCTVSVTGAGGLNLTPSATYANNLLVGTASAGYTYAGDANHTGSADAETFLITTAFRIIGFDSPVDMTPIGHERYYNSVKNGQTVPLKFRVYNLDGTEVSSTSGLSAMSRSVSCVSGDIDPTLLPIDSTADTGLRRTGDRFHFNWAVPKGAGKCYQILVRTVDGSTTMVGSLAGTPVHEAYFRSK